MNKPEKKKSHIPVDGKPVDAVIIPSVKGLSEKFDVLTIII
jgi:hypothetical protein